MYGDPFGALAGNVRSVCRTESEGEIMRPPVTYKNYGTYLWTMITDKTGTIYQTLAGNVGPNTPWGIRVWRIPPGKTAELIYFIEGGNGTLYVDDITKKLYFYGTDNVGAPYYVEIAGFVYPSDKPDVTVVNINENQVAVLKQEIATSNAIANRASATANTAVSTANDTAAQIIGLQRQIGMMQQQITALQSQVIPRNQIEDIVWSKIWDVNYLIRLGFLDGKSAIPQVQDYLHDLGIYIKSFLK